MIGLPEGTRLELVPPEPLVEDLSLNEVAANAEAAKSRGRGGRNKPPVKRRTSGLKNCRKWHIFPTIAIIGGYAKSEPSGAMLFCPKIFSYNRRHGYLDSLLISASASHGVKRKPAHKPKRQTLRCKLTKAKVGAGRQEQLSRTGTLAQTQFKLAAPDGVRDSSD